MTRLSLTIHRAISLVRKGKARLGVKRDMSTAPLHIQTPLLQSRALEHRVGRHGDVRVFLKLDNTQPGGSFKTRGIGAMCVEAVDEGAQHLVSSSGGNAGLAVAYAGRMLGVPSTVLVPETTPEYMRTRLALEGALVQVSGQVWDETNASALALAESNPDYAYISPFDHPTIWKGHATVIHEIHEQLAPRGIVPDLILVSVGGGGFFNGVMQGLAEVGWTDTTSVLAMETSGANAFQQAVQSKSLVKLQTITSVAKSLGALCVSAQALTYALENPRKVISGTVSDEEAIAACVEFAHDHHMLVEPACGAALAPVYFPSILRRILLDLDSVEKTFRHICVLVCGGNMTRLPTVQPTPGSSGTD